MRRRRQRTFPSEYYKDGNTCWLVFVRMRACTRAHETNCEAAGLVSM